MKTLEFIELLDRLARTRKHAQNIEPNLTVLISLVMHGSTIWTHSLAQRSTLTNSDAISLLHTECWTDVGG
jgi:hypothetical protein